MKQVKAIIGTFVRKNKILSFLEMLKNDFKIDTNGVFVFEIETNKYEYLASFKCNDKDYFLNKIPHSSVLHIKNGCLFSINALNKLIDKEKENSSVPNNEYVIDWNKYKNKLIILTNGELVIPNLNKIEDFSQFFK